MLVGQHLAIVSPKPQATRLPVVGLRTEEDTQYIFHDLPGLLEPTYLMQERMRALAFEGLDTADVILHLHPAPAGTAPPFTTAAGLATPPAAPVITVYTKMDLIEATDGQMGRWADGLPVSAQTGAGLSQLLAAVRRRLPQREFEFDPADVGTQPLRFFVVEYLREAAFQVLEEEVPYAVTAEVEEFREDARPVYIRITLYVERESQKGIVVGRGGQTIKAIGIHARARMESLLGTAVFLDCRVKVLPNWRKHASALERFGFPGP